MYFRTKYVDILFDAHQFLEWLYNSVEFYFSFAWKSFTLCLEVSMGYTINTWKLLKSEKIHKNSLIYIILSITIVSLIFLVVWK